MNIGTNMKPRTKFGYVGWGLIVILIIIFSIWTMQTLDFKRALAEVWAEDLEECVSVVCHVDSWGNMACEKAELSDMFYIDLPTSRNNSFKFSTSHNR
jgi:hypothetical protein